MYHDCLHYLNQENRCKTVEIRQNCAINEHNKIFKLRTFSDSLNIYHERFTSLVISANLNFTVFTQDKSSPEKNPYSFQSPAY